MLHIVDHPCVRAKLSILRDRATPCVRFRECVREVTSFIAAEALRGVELESFPVKTPLAETTGYRIANAIVFVPILRAGLGMLEAAQSLVPDSAAGFVGLERDHVTRLPREYYCKLPEATPNSFALLLDPMLATGNSLAAAADLLKQAGFRRIAAVTIISAPEGKAVFEARHPGIDVFTGCLDERLDENKYIVPGLGDAGDRIFETEHV